MAQTKRIVLRPGDRPTRDALRTAHDSGMHGTGDQDDVLAYWAETCADCHARWYYEHGPGRAKVRA